jgi:hypothetical protein
MKLRPNPLVLSAALLAVFTPDEASAVRVDPDGLGQALIYPYYTARSSDTKTFQTYLTVVNHAADVKALRVRFREGRNARPVASFNVFLGPQDMFAVALGADQQSGGATLLLQSELSCVGFGTPPTQPAAIPFDPSSYGGTLDDGAGATRDRTREGFVEVLEMATLTGASATNATHTGIGMQPPNCAALRSGQALEIAPPTGGLSGTATLINVNDGMDFSVDATALADLSTQPFYRHHSDPYPDLNAAEIEPISMVTANGAVYRSTWGQAVDAVSAVLMRTSPMAETVLDPETRSTTDVIVTFPTRPFYVTNTSFAAPFYRAFSWPADSCGDAAAPRSSDVNFMPIARLYDRDERRISEAETYFTGQGPRPTCDAAAAVHDFIDRAAAPSTPLRSGVFGSPNRAFARAPMRTELKSGWIDLMATAFVEPGPQALVSLPTSRKVVIATGETTTGSHTYRGLPMVGFAARTFQNGTLTCQIGSQPAGACQGNYGGSFPLKFRRSISP